MCLLTYVPAAVQPDYDALARGAALNDDGHGFAVVAGDEILVHRGMDAEAVIAEFRRIRHQYADGPALFHSRFATHGTVGVANTHPFPVGRDPRTVLAHNGVLPATVHPATGDQRSDTRIAAEDFLSAPRFRSLERRATRRRIARWLGHHNKVVVLTTNPRYPRQAYLFNQQAGHWDGGIWYSNLDYRTRGIDLRHDSWSLGDGCAYCGLAAPADPDSGLCGGCGSCPICGSDPGDCPPLCDRVRVFLECPECGDDFRHCSCPLTQYDTV